MNTAENSAPETKAQPQELAIVETAITRINAVDKGLADLRKKFGGVVFDVKTADGMAEAKAARKEIATIRIDVEKVRVEAKAPLLTIQRNLDGTANRIKAAIKAIEDPIDQQITAEEERIAREEQAKKDAEAARVTAIMGRIANIKGATVVASKCVSAEQIARHMDDLNDINVDDGSFEEFHGEAYGALVDALNQVRDMHTAALAREEQQRKLDAQQAEIDRQRAEQAAKDKKAAEDRAAEQLRVDSIREDIRELHGNRSLTASSGSALIASFIFDLENLPVTPEKFEEFLPEANVARAAGLEFYQNLHAAALVHEAEQAKLKQQREEQEAAERERQRVAAIKLRVAFFPEAVISSLRMQTSAEVSRLLALVESRTVDEAFGEFLAEGQEAKAHAIETLQLSLKSITERENAAREKLEREANERREREAAEQAERDAAAERERKAEEERKANFVPERSEMIAVLANHYQRDEATVDRWLANAYGVQEVQR